MRGIIAVRVEPGIAAQEGVISTPDGPPRVHLNEISERLEIEYPCRWLYKVIGSDAHELREAILEIIDVAGMTMELSNTSSGGKYLSLNVEVTVRDEGERLRFYESLRDHPAVRMVL